MGRFLLLMCAGALVVGTLAMGSTRKALFEQDRRLSVHEANVVARESALSAMNQALPFLAEHFDALTSGQPVDVRALGARPLTLASGSTADAISCTTVLNRYNTDEAYRRRYTWGADVPNVSEGTVSTFDLCRRYVGRRSVRLVQGGQVQLVGQTVKTLLPTRELGPGSTSDVAVRARPGGKIEVVATGTYAVLDADGALSPRTFTVRRLYAKASVLDAALIALAPAIAPTFSGNYLVDGRDITSGSTPSGNDARYRVAVKTNPPLVAQRIGAAAGAANASRFMGVNGPGDIVSGSVVADIDAIFDEAYVHSARSVVPGVLPRDTTMGTTSAPAIVVAQNGLEIQGSVRGAGILVVNGDLQTTGTGRLLSLIHI